MCVLNSFLPGGGEFTNQKIARGFCQEGGWSGLELTDTLQVKIIASSIN